MLEDFKERERRMVWLTSVAASLAGGKLSGTAISAADNVLEQFENRFFPKETEQ